MTKKNDYFPSINCCNIAILGLGYVGLPLAIEFARSKDKISSSEKGKVYGFDIDQTRINQLIEACDVTNEIEKNQLLQRKYLEFTSDSDFLKICDVFIVTVPTPLTENNQPDFNALINASKMIGKAMKEGALKRNKVPFVIFESTVYPGATEEICLPILIKYSGMNLYSTKKENSFALGYSPERVNPGDKKNKLVDIIKVTSGCCEETSLWIDNLYKKIIKAGTYRAKSITIAEASKVIENVQRDINIAIVNEFALIFNKLSIDTLDVLEAAQTKWNFLKFRPGLVGGHCIGVDPYYLTYKSKQIGYYPDLISSSRRLNNGMGIWISEQVIVEIVKRSLIKKELKILMLGISFKENCPDIRNSKVFDIYNSLKKYDFQIDIFDPVVDIEKVKEDHNIIMLSNLGKNKKYDVVILSVAHDLFKNFAEKDWSRLLSNKGFIFDIKGIAPRSLNPIRI
tara:strand:+ start:45 stop:1409 length:1365 start_codon:yes stop_codon:yes gene_type:complete